MTETSGITDMGNDRTTPVSSVKITVPDLIGKVSAEIDRLSAIRDGILADRTPWYAYVALVIPLLLNLWALVTYQDNYLILWISASLYFYIIYPLLPMVVLLLPLITGKKDQKDPDSGKNEEKIMTWASNLRVHRNKKVVFRLAWRFFLLSLIPMTAGILTIYSLSIVFSILLLFMAPSVSIDTIQLLVIQCIGIIAFYLEIYLFRNRFYALSSILRQEKDWRDRKRMLFILLVGLVLFLLALLITVLIVVAIFLPGHTLTTFISVNSFARLRTNIFIVVLLISQFIFMQCIQSVFSSRFVLDMVTNLNTRLTRMKDTLSGVSGAVPTEEDKKATLDLVQESSLYDFNKKQMLGLFHTYYIAISFRALRKIRNLEELKGIFQMK